MACTHSLASRERKRPEEPALLRSLTLPGSPCMQSVCSSLRASKRQIRGRIAHPTAAEVKQCRRCSRRIEPNRRTTKNWPHPPNARCRSSSTDCCSRWWRHRVDGKAGIPQVILTGIVIGPGPAAGVVQRGLTAVVRVHAVTLARHERVGGAVADLANPHAAVVVQHSIERGGRHRPGTRAGVGEIAVYSKIIGPVLNHRLRDVIRRTNRGRRRRRPGGRRTATVAVFPFGQVVAEGVDLVVEVLLLHEGQDGGEPRREGVRHRRLRAAGLGGGNAAANVRSVRHHDARGEPIVGAVVSVQARPICFRLF